MSNRKSLAIILFITAIILFLLLPIRDQVYRDDFAYAQSVKHFVETGQFKVSEWAAPTLILQILWGGLFSKILGFSLGTLHVSVVILLPIILIFIYKILRIVQIKLFDALILTIFFLSIPFILQFTYTFQTDIPFLTLEIASVYYYLKGFKKNNSQNLFIGSVLAIAGFMIRQISIVLIVSAALTVLIKFNDFTKKQLLKRLMTVCFLPIFVLGIYFIWLYSNGNQTVTQIFSQNYINKEVLTLLPFSNIGFSERIKLILLLNHRFVALFSLVAGLFAIPLSIITLSNLSRIKNSINNFILFGSIFTVFVFWGIDYIFLRDSFVLGFPIDTYKYEHLFPVHWPIVWKFLVLLGITSLAVINSINLSFDKTRDSKIIFLLLSFVLLTGMSISFIYYWDRYSLLLLPFFLIFVGLKLRSLYFPKVLFTIIVLLLLFDSFQMTKVRYDINGTAQREANRLIKTGISPIKIIPNEEEFWLYWYTFEDQMKLELAKVKGDKNKAVIPSLPDNLLYVKSNNGKAYTYLNEFMIISKQDIMMIPSRFTFTTLKIINIRSLLVKSELYLIKINNLYNDDSNNLPSLLFD